MGKWTSDYCDDILNTKIKSLVSGAIKRAMLEKEKTEPTISYRDFVEELEPGDSFTASIIDIMVKELADRRSRQNLSDRKLIAERTAKSLRALTMDYKIIRRRSIARRPMLSEYLTSPPARVVDMDDDDEFDHLLDPMSSTMEGVRINSNLYDAYGNDSWNDGWIGSTGAPTVVRHRSPTPTDVLSGSDPQVQSPPPADVRRNSTSSSMLSSITSSHTSPSRVPSIRRPFRSRTVDFNEFTSRRRSTIRDSLRQSLGILSESPEPSHITDSRERESAWPPSSSSARRFFPLPRRGRLRDSPPAEIIDIVEENGEPRSALPSSRWYPFPTPVTSRSPVSMPTTEISEERTLAVPRLRRGGVRAPESMLSRHASPLADIGTLPSPVSLGDTADIGDGDRARSGLSVPPETEN
ncbi:uncharacterized protein BT62DRAFT_993194 [Guyanagaster necrorhizus]|uniref:Uncharacterized protein n=1 Tax=Guyanagaster necrorhizus TaxID=856835 RepID=A0A9P8ATK2_9AGAR|nr:uncharacterized protein BT62DRAFT_993194 [Guyanagaster necrorhizus MCA 3950]KAG7447499.1 hypothetical protein BT62DRAFT_993194 [Guyanagaster necrorhizus MCA 3950]